MAEGVVGRTRGGTSPRLGCNDGEEMVRVEEDKGVGWSFPTKWNGGGICSCGCREIGSRMVVVVAAVEDGREPRDCCRCEQEKVPGFDMRREVDDKPRVCTFAEIDVCRVLLAPRPLDLPQQLRCRHEHEVALFS